MKASISCIALLLCVTAAWADEPVQVTEANVTFLYESRAEIRPPDHTLAEIISTDYRNARDEFTRHDLLQEIKPIIEKRMTEGRETNSVVLKIGGTIRDYDFEQNAFPTGFSTATYVRVRDNSVKLMQQHGPPSSRRIDSRAGRSARR